MKKLPDKAEIVEQIVRDLGRPLRKDHSKAQAFAATERTIKSLSIAHEIPRPDAGSISKAAKNLQKALELLSGEMPIFPKDFDRPQMPYLLIREFRSALDYLGHSHGPSRRFDNTKYCAAIYGFRLVNEFRKSGRSRLLMVRFARLEACSIWLSPAMRLI